MLLFFSLRCLLFSSPFWNAPWFSVVSLGFDGPVGLLDTGLLVSVQIYPVMPFAMLPPILVYEAFRQGFFLVLCWLWIAFSLS